MQSDFNTSFNRLKHHKSPTFWSLHMQDNGLSNRSQGLYQPGAWAVKTQDRATHIFRKRPHYQSKGKYTTSKWVKKHNATCR